jgi:hypothetical protein
MKRKPTKPQQPTVSAAPGAAGAFEELTDEIAAIRDEDVLPINVDIERAASIALAAASHLTPLGPQFKALPDFDHKTPSRLRTYALAALYAHVVANEASRGDERFTPVLEEATKLRELLLGAAELLSLFGLVSAERVADIRTGTGHLDTASDLIALHALFGEHWKRVAGKTPVTREQVDRAGVLGTELHELVASRKFVGPGDPDVDDPRSQVRRVPAGCRVPSLEVRRRRLVRAVDVPARASAAEHSQ